MRQSQQVAFFLPLVQHNQCVDMTKGSEAIPRDAVEQVVEHRWFVGTHCMISRHFLGLCQSVAAKQKAFHSGNSQVTFMQQCQYRLPASWGYNHLCCLAGCTHLVHSVHFYAYKVGAIKNFSG